MGAYYHAPPDAPPGLFDMLGDLVARQLSALNGEFALLLAFHRAHGTERGKRAGRLTPRLFSPHLAPSSRHNVYLQVMFGILGAFYSLPSVVVFVFGGIVFGVVYAWLHVNATETPRESDVAKTRHVSHVDATYAQAATASLSALIELSVSLIFLARLTLTSHARLSQIDDNIPLSALVCAVIISYIFIAFAS